MLYYYSLQSRFGHYHLSPSREALIRLIPPQDADLVKDPYLARHFSGRSWKSGAPT